MRAPMKLLSPLVLLLLLGGGLGCGKEIGDECVINPDCSPNGDRVCIDPPNGYCTVVGCDVSTCPEEAVCVRFFNGSFINRPCDRFTEDNLELPSEERTNACSLDEQCAITSHCVPRSSEIRFCMRRCDSDSDCRTGYECRDFGRMVLHGGEPVLRPGEVIDETNAVKFCAAAPGG
jgi:hypothetical protein